MRLPAIWMSRERNSASARENVSASPCAMAWPMISIMSVSRCWTSSRPCPAASRAASGSIVQRSSLSSRRWSSRLRPEGPPFDDVRIEEVPVADGAHARTDVRARTDQALGLQDAERLTDDGAGHLETLADLLGHQRGRSAPTPPETIIWPSCCWTSWPCSRVQRPPAGRRPYPAQLRVRAVPRGDSDTAGCGCLRVGIAVEFARAGEAGVCGAGGGHHGVRKGTHGTPLSASLPTPLRSLVKSTRKGDRSPRRN
ncbi:hypothetical protein SALBM311S_09499 [Streptomyces alboniger]